MIEPRRLDGTPDLLVGVLGTQVRMVHRFAARLAELLMPDPVGGTHGGPRVAGRGVDVQVLERGLLEDLAVGHRVVGAAAGQAQRPFRT